MDRQAEALRARAAAAGIGPAASASPGATLPKARLARAIAVASGKGGVGKSTVALGIAMASGERGVRTVLVDADLGMANADILAGVRAKHSVAEWLAGRVQLSDCMVRVAPRTWLLAGASGIARMADLDAAHRARLLGGLARIGLHVDRLVIDLGAGIGAGTLDLACAADRVLVVTTPEPTSLADAYAFMKACARRGRRDGWHCAASMARGDDGARACERLARTAERHLGVRPEFAGAVPEDDAVRSSVRASRPVLAAAPASGAARAIRGLESRLSGIEATRAPTGIGFLARLSAHWSGSAAAAAATMAAVGGALQR
jgi:flagellar biosynthesis protein FlhG